MCTKKLRICAKRSYLESELENEEDQQDEDILSKRNWIDWVKNSGQGWR